MRKKLLSIGGVFALFAFLNFTHAQEGDLFEMSLEQLMNIEVTTASQKAQKISDAPATVISYSADQIEKFGWRDLKDMFRSVTGIDVSYDVQGEIKTIATMRGVEGNQKILVLQDGQRQNPITGERFIFGHNIPLHIYKRIEIVFGPASALYGADAYAGVINLITKDGKDIDGITGSVGYVSTNSLVTNLSFGKQITDDIDVVISGRIYRGEDYKWHEQYKDPLDYKIVNEYEGELGKKEAIYPIRNWNLLTKLKYKKFTFGFDWQHELESNAPSTIPANYAYIENNVWGQDIRHMYVNYDAVTKENFDLQATVSLGDYALNPASNFFIPIDSDNNGIPDNGAASYKYGYSGYTKGSVKADWRTSDKINIIGGFSYDNVISFPKTQNLDKPYGLDGGLIDDLSMFVDSNNYVFGLVGFSDSIFEERNYYNIGSFIQAEIKPIEALSITVGARYDYNSIYEGTFNPRIGLVYKATESLTLKALAGTAYIQPSNYYRWENWANPYAMHIPNEDIKPEKLQTYELSGTYFVSKNISFRTSIFRNEMKDIIRPIPASAQTNNYPYYNPYRTLIGEQPGTGFVEINANLGSQYSQGLELDVNYQVSKLLISLGYSYLDGEDEESDTKIPKVSAHKLNANITWSGEKFSGTLSGRYYSDIYTAISNSYYAGKKEIPGAFVVYTNLLYKINKNYSLHLTAENLLNTKHWGAAPYGEGVWIQPRAPQYLLKIYGGITFKF